MKLSLRTGWAFAVLLLPAAAGAYWWRTAPDVQARSSPDIVFFVVDTLRADHLSAYGYERRTSPNISKWASKGVLFESAYSAAPWTLPSTASLLTGLYPKTHGAGVWGDVRGVDSPATKLTLAATTLPERLTQFGYACGCWTANPFLTLGLQQGFDPFWTAQGSAVELANWALDKITAPHDRPIFAYVQVMDVHDPHPVPDEFFKRFPTPEADARQERHRGFGETSTGNIRGEELAKYAVHRIAAYDGAVSYVDQAFGRMMDGLQDSGRLDNTIVVLTSDHGEELWDHFEMEMEGYRDPRGYVGIGHGHTHFEELIHVPLVIWAPGAAQGKRVASQVSTVDVSATILDMLGLPEKLHPGSPSRSLRPAVMGGEIESLPVYSQQVSYGYKRYCIITPDRRKVVISRNPEEFTFAFDLKADPKEKKNLWRSADFSRFRELEAEATKFFNDQPARLATIDAPDVSPDVIERLKAVGYCGIAGPSAPVPPPEQK